MNLDPHLDGQLDLFEPPTSPPSGAYDEPDNAPRPLGQLIELPGETFEDIFGDAA